MKRAIVFVHVNVLVLMFLFLVPAGLAENALFPPTQAQEGNNVESELESTLENVLYDMYVDEVKVGTVKFASSGLVIYDRALLELIASFDREVFVEGIVQFRRNENDDEQTAEGLIIDSIKEVLEVYTNTYAISIGEEVIAYLSSEEEAQKVLDLVKEPYRHLVQSKENTTLEEIYIAEQPSISVKTVPYDSMISVEEALAIITVGVEKASEYVVQEGDTLWDIANEHNIDISDIMLANPDLKGERIHPGDLLRIMDVRNLTTVFTREIHTYKERIDYDTEIRTTNELFVGQERVARQGQDGENEVEIFITRENGEETDRGIIKDTIIEEPVSRILERGTRARPAAPRTTTASRGNQRPGDLSPIPRDGVVKIPWFDGVEDIFHRGMIVKVTHVNTGLTFYARRLGGRFHADSEPLTAEDTEILRRIYGGSFSWDRQAILVEIGRRRIAASMNGMPHGGELIQDNNFQGHFCIHFYGSLVHETGRRCAQHQAMVRYAAGE